MIEKIVDEILNFKTFTFLTFFKLLKKYDEEDICESFLTVYDCASENKKKQILSFYAPAYIYIDDRSVKFEGDFKKTLKEVKNFSIRSFSRHINS